MSDTDHEPIPPLRKDEFGEDAGPGDRGGKRRGRWTAIALSAVAGLALGGGAYAWRASQTPEPLPLSQAVSGQPAIGGVFQLIDQDNRPVTEQALRGKWTAVFFGYTACPDFCPTTLQSLQGATERLGEQADDLQVLLITVDPERDTPAALKTYLEGYDFPGGVRGLTGTREQVDAAAKAWRVYHRKAPASDAPAGTHAGHGGSGGSGGYLVDHFTGVFLMNPQGEFVQVFTHGLTPDEAARQIRAAMKA